jgi:hypothetical protein
MRPPALNRNGPNVPVVSVVPVVPVVPVVREVPFRLSWERNVRGAAFDHLDVTLAEFLSNLPLLQVARYKKRQQTLYQTRWHVSDALGNAYLELNSLLPEKTLFLVQREFLVNSKMLKAASTKKELTVREKAQTQTHEPLGSTDLDDIAFGPRIEGSLFNE